MMTVVLTGGIGSGKSTAARLFKMLGAAYFDADAVVRELLLDKAVQNQLTKRWGADIIGDSACDMRQRLRDKLLNSEADKRWLEELLHPLVLRRLTELQRNATQGYLLAEIPLYFQMSTPPHADRVLLIDCPRAMRVKRLKDRGFSNLTESQIDRLIAIQICKVDRDCVDDVICNDASLEELQKQVTILHHKYLNMASTML